MRGNHWIAAGTVAMVLIGALLWMDRPQAEPPSFRNSDQLLTESGRLFAVGDSAPYSGPVMDYHPNGNKAYSVTVVDGVAQGLAREWHENGQKKTEATLQDGEAVGVLRGWYDNGQPRYDVPLQNGEAEGITTEYYPGGQRRNETMYARGQRHGTETGYSEAGLLEWKAEWRHDRLHGEYTEFYPNGQKRSATQYESGITEGPATGWFESGEKSWTAQWADDTPVGTHMEWYVSGQLMRQKQFSAGQLTVLHEWHRNGKAMVEAVYAKGLLVSQKRWDDNGTLLLTMGEANPPRSNTPKPVVTENPDDKPNPNAAGRRTAWVTTRLNAVYQGKSSATVKAAFGAPDQRLGDTWVYRGMMIIDLISRRRLSTAQFLIKDGKVLEVVAN